MKSSTHGCVEGQVWKPGEKQLKYLRHSMLKRINYGLPRKADQTFSSSVDNYSEKVKAM